MQHVTVQQSSSHQPGIADYVRQVGHWVAFVRSAMTVARERRMLLQLDDRMLKTLALAAARLFTRRRNRSPTCRSAA